MRDDLEQTKETVASSFARLPLLVDVRLVSTYDLSLFSSVKGDPRDGLPQLSPVLDELRKDREESFHHVKELRDDVNELRDHVEQS
jgi:hypothetical protein